MNGPIRKGVSSALTRVFSRRAAIFRGEGPGEEVDHAIYDVYSLKAVKTLMYLKFYEYSTLYLVQDILPFCVIEALDSK